VAWVPASVLVLVSVPAEKDLGLVMDHSTKEKLLKVQGSNYH
jgi:hypothetical protein